MKRKEMLETLYSAKSRSILSKILDMVDNDVDELEIEEFAKDNYIYHHYIELIKPHYEKANFELREENRKKALDLISKLTNINPTAYDQMRTGPFGVIPTYALIDRKSEYWESEELCSVITSIVEIIGEYYAKPSVDIIHITDDVYLQKDVEDNLFVLWNNKSDCNIALNSQQFSYLAAFAVN